MENFANLGAQGLTPESDFYVFDVQDKLYWLFGMIYEKFYKQQDKVYNGPWDILFNEN